MLNNARSWRVVAGGVAAGVTGVVGFAGTIASADPALPAPPAPAPVTVTQTVTAAPTAVAATVTPAAPAPEVPTSVVAQPVLTTPAPTPALSTPAPTPALVPASSGTLTDFFKEKGVALEPQNPRDFRALNITLPMPTGWSQVPDPNVPDAFAVLKPSCSTTRCFSTRAKPSHTATSTASSWPTGSPPTRR